MSTATPKKSAIKTRRWRPEDILALVECQRAAYTGFAESTMLDERHFAMQLEAFKDGQVLAEVDGKIVGYAAALIVALDEDSPWYSYPEITGVGTFSTHDPSGDTLYGADIAVHPDYRGRGIAGLLYAERKKTLKRFNLRRMMASGRIPGYSRYVGALTAEEYVEAVTRGDIKDSVLSPQLQAGYRTEGVHHDYLSDADSLDYATLLVMDNPDFRADRRRIAAAPIRVPARKVRVCAAQYQMRRVANWDEFRQQVEFFCTTADTYSCHFLVFPELFTAQLFSTMPPETPNDVAVAQLCDMHGRYVDMFKELAAKHGLYIVGGSTPVRVGDGIRNVAHLFTPGGEVHTQDKLHITPAERKLWGVQPGTGLKIFETPFARIAIQVCYDIEFPEVSRMLTLRGAEVIFVPFSTDERHAYLRVRYSAQGCAVQNMLYVVLAGNVGNLPQVRSFLINYGKAMICTPSDFAFPSGAIAAEAEANMETVVIGEIDLSDLAQQREMGSVRPLRDRRPDLYDFSFKIPIERVRVS